MKKYFLKNCTICCYYCRYYSIISSDIDGLSFVSRILFILLSASNVLICSLTFHTVHMCNKRDLLALYNQVEYKNKILYIRYWKDQSHAQVKGTEFLLHILLVREMLFMLFMLLVFNIKKKIKLKESESESVLLLFVSNKKELNEEEQRIRIRIRNRAK